MNAALVMAPATFAWGLQGLARLHLVSFDPKVLQDFTPPHDLLSLQRAATAIGLRSGLLEVHAVNLQELPAPFVAVLAPKRPSQANRLVLALRCNSNVITFLEEGKQHSSTHPLVDFQKQFAGVVMLSIREVRQSTGVAGYETNRLD